MESFIEQYRSIIETLPSYHDLKDENSYHMMMLGICIMLPGDYDINSNREWGEGRSDILLRSRKEVYPHVIMEFKYTKDESCDLKCLAAKALEQIDRRHYTFGLEGSVLCIGLAHRGKKCGSDVGNEVEHKTLISVFGYGYRRFLRTLYRRPTTKTVQVCVTTWRKR